MKTSFSAFEHGEPLTYPALDGRTLIATVESYGSQFPVLTVVFRQWGKEKPLTRITVTPDRTVKSIYYQILDTIAPSLTAERQTQLKYATK